MSVSEMSQLTAEYEEVDAREKVIKHCTEQKAYETLGRE